ncbi:MAG: hypothetical protein JWO70_4139 [Betaproteobacteria bacterium]|jgi:hypothetical protein|nr:hypothetical protein [Betaproteobacteria bacterium]
MESGDPYYRPAVRFAAGAGKGVITNRERRDGRASLSWTSDINSPTKEHAMAEAITLFTKPG